MLGAVFSKLSNVLNMHCSIYKSSKKDEMYLYVARPSENDAEASNPLDVVPEALRVAFGRATFVMHIELSETRKLARVNVLHVMDSIQTNGFFIQMPPEGLINPNAVAPEGLRGA
ncbi:UPF0745 protein [Acinetobacter tandoii DSM 14970 = CIP 107469]|jgi:uncharacterized protein YcgL (UPF0745 family)|uniref:YcgL domain-containing protein I593_01183 n=2 Tax=Acinetobacter tandoii TaxID=202954 RepID=R9B3V3_9GAMM|nr:UPF0745 protein [Acinetobacter tandoii DSM 14970 = CIP 107469]